MNPVSVPVSDASSVSAARVEVQRMARQLEMDELRAGRAAIIVTEAVTNMLRHAQGGHFFAQSISRGDGVGIEMLAIDAGPGIDDFAHSATDGVTSGDTPGTGLGAIRRQADEFDIYTRPGNGTVMRMVVWAGGIPVDDMPYEIGSVCVPKPGESASGDAWDFVTHAGGVTFVVADGLGHGTEAARASSSAVETLHRHPDYSALRLLDVLHGKLRPTRGAAVAVMRHEAEEGTMAFAGVGNIAACFWDGKVKKSMISHNGIVGHNVHKSQEYLYPWPSESLLIAHSDGLESQWSLDAFPGIARCHPSIVAALLFRDHSRRRDDTVVVVARHAA